MRPCVLVFSGSDPSGGAGISADIEAIAAQDSHALPIITAITVQDNDRVFSVHPVAIELILEQAKTLVAKIPIRAIKIGIIGSRLNAMAIALWISEFKKLHPNLPVILDPVLASGHGDALAVDTALENAAELIAPLMRIATLITPNLHEAELLCPNAISTLQQGQQLMNYGAAHVLIKGGHSKEPIITNSWFHDDQQMHWQWQRFSGEFHGSGCTLAAAIAGQLAHSRSMQLALEMAQSYCQEALKHAYSITSGQLIPKRTAQHS
ncbi:MAG: hydroxymethylpyrimidine/phosphomethylpyrimidine kinase [Solimicrobium sp.]|nr:hydroxymethylpyrimidine/phosphomethylpyrimidine kinase [Solimicrobium sp.]